MFSCTPRRGKISRWIRMNMTGWMTKNHPSITISKHLDATSPKDVSNIFLNYLRQKFGPIDIDSDSLHLLQAHVQQLYPASPECLEQPVTLERSLERSGPAQGTKNRGSIASALSSTQKIRRRYTWTSSRCLSKCSYVTTQHIGRSMGY